MKLGLIGGTLGHSCSPIIHEKLFRALQLHRTCEYHLLEMDRTNISNELKRLYREQYVGMNVTIPYKLDVIPFLTDISRESRIIGAVNTIHITADGCFGYNTDYSGFGRSLEHAGIAIKNKRCIILGSGGAARAVVQYIADQDADSIVVVSQHPHEKMGFDALAKKVDAEIIPYKNAGTRYGDVLINCTPVGMYPYVDKCPVNESFVSQFAAVVDLIYNPKETRLIQIAKRHGSVTLNGMYMLVAQAIASEEIWQNRCIGMTVINDIAKEMESYYE